MQTGIASTTLPEKLKAKTAPHVPGMSDRADLMPDKAANQLLRQDCRPCAVVSGYAWIKSAETAQRRAGRAENLILVQIVSKTKFPTHNCNHVFAVLSDA